MEPVILDTDTLSELGRGNLQVRRRASEYLAELGRLTTTSVTVFECLRGFRLALRDGLPFEGRLEAFLGLVAASEILPFDEAAAGAAARIWASTSRSRRHHHGDVLIAGIACSRRLPLATRNRRDFEGLSSDAGVPLTLVDWTRSSRKET